MNYLAEILAFSEWKEVNPLPASAIALWYEIMAAWNKTGWQQEFTVQNGLLQAKCGLSRKEFDHARQILINLGRIYYKKSNRVNEAGKYTVIPIVQKGQQEGQQKEHRRDNSEGNERDNAGDTLYKLKLKHKQKHTDDDAPSPVKQVIDFYHDLFVEKFGIKPVISGQKDGSLVKKLINQYGADQVIKLLERFFVSEDSFIQQSGYTLGAFYSQVNKLLTANVVPMNKRKMALGEDLPWA